MPTLIIVLPLILLGILLKLARISRAEDRVEQWARENGYTLLSRQRRTLFRGPFAFTTRRRHVYEITVQDPAGNQRHGYLRLGRSNLWMTPDNTEVRWE